MNEEEKKYIDIFINKCEKYDESVEVKGVSVGEESRILDIVVKYLKSIEKQQSRLETQRIFISEEAKLNEELKIELKKKDKIIDLMAKELVDSLETCSFDMYDYGMENCKNCEDYFEKCWIEYFTKKASEE